MVKQTINIKGITEKQGKTGQVYFVIDTNKGKMSCFPDYKGLRLLRDAWKNDAEIEVNIETSDDGKFLNIRDEKKAVAQDGDAPIYQPRKSVKGQYPIEYKGEFRKSVKGSAYEKDPVGLAVEMFIAIIEDARERKADIQDTELMKNCCSLVKQAQKAFS